MTKIITSVDITGIWSSPRRNGSQHLIKKGWLHRQKKNFKKDEQVFVLEFESGVLNSNLIRVVKKRVIRANRDIAEVRDFTFKGGHHGWCSSEEIESFRYHFKSWGSEFYLISKRTYDQIKHRLIPCKK